MQRAHAKDKDVSKPIILKKQLLLMILLMTSITEPGTLVMNTDSLKETLQEGQLYLGLSPGVTLFSTKSDHSAIRGPSFSKFNSTLVNDNEHCELLGGNF